MDNMSQFRTNGKAHSKEQNRRVEKVWVTCFNSLRTGRLIQRIMGTIAFPIEATRFNSLRTGRLIQRVEESLIGPMASGMFQFPTNGKAHSKSCPLC